MEKMDACCTEDSIGATSYNLNQPMIRKLHEFSILNFIQNY